MIIPVKFGEILASSLEDMLTDVGRTDEQWWLTDII